MSDLPPRNEQPDLPKIIYNVSELQEYERLRLRSERRLRTSVLTTLLPAIMGVIWFLLGPRFVGFLDSQTLVLLNTVSTIFLFSSIAAAAYLYLQTGFKPDGAATELPSTTAPTYQPRRANDEPQGLEPLRTGTLSPQQTVPPATEDEHLRDITRCGDEITRQLGEAVEYQTRRNNLNLGIGFFITLFGIGALLFFVQQYKDIDAAKPLTILNFVPRLSLVFLIELFAYFFLNLYRNGLAEVKYLQNELTNVRMRSLGLRTAIREADKESAAHIMKAFGDTDRNAATARSAGAKTNTEEVLKTAQEALKLAGKVANAKSD